MGVGELIMSIKILPSDRVFSQYIRLKDGQCMRCRSPVRRNDKGLPVSHHASHFWGRGRENTRYDEMNVTTHCHGCHAFLTANPELHRQWKLEQIGQKEYDKLMLRANTACKKDEAMRLMAAKELLKTVLDNV